MGALAYDPAYFDAPTLYEAKRLMFPGDPEKFEERWNGDTAFLRDMLIRELQPKVGDLLLDYGCGIGRIAREMCLLGCNVIGVESSAVCRRYAVEYVNQPGRFLAVSPEEFDLLNRKGLKCDLGCAFWVLQHCAAPAGDIERISRGLKTLSRLLIANARSRRLVPVRNAEGKSELADDRIDIWQLLGAHFGLHNTITYPYGLGLKPEEYLLRGYCKTI